MYTEAELLTAIDEVNNGKHTIQNCIKLAALYTVLDNQYKPSNLSSGYSADFKEALKPMIVESEFVGDYGDTEFLTAIKGKKLKDMWLLMDELMGTLSLINKSLYNSVLDRIE